MKNFSVHSIPIQDLRPYEENPRKWDSTSETHLRQSIERFGLVDPIIVNNHHDRKNIIVGGHFRWHIAKQLGFKEVPVVYVHLDPEKEKELNLRLNRNTGEWDLDLLKSFDTNLLLEFGFSETDLSSIWDDVLTTEDDDFQTSKKLEDLKEPTVRLGEMYQLGNHRLLCGDSTLPENIQRLVGDARIQMLYCDPVYNIDLSYDKGVGGKKKYGGKAKDARSQEEYRAFLKATIENALSVSEENTHVFYWCDQNYVGMVQGLYEELGLTNRRVCLWIKNSANPTPQIAFSKCYEPCVYATRGKPYLNTEATKFTEIMNKDIDAGNRSIDDILDYLDLWLVKRLSTSTYAHPTEKPVTLHEKALRRCTRIGDNVLELFGGSGSTLIACEQLKRNCFIMELDPIFASLIIQRYEELTGIKAVLLA
ncbi:hypothetical protein COW46_01405 [Candidatus Gracilibacteria bacterium CG17_big_fil_post_rev_8_21_14_2_50_48_13]|nr:MAG: hypothetical protein COW46_01405 [Candidatus Gracilibacteria bacterium CG17_big_fil_post_rev_8_21_14_2_50_48_13]